jgi:hypothetical protein
MSLATPRPFPPQLLPIRFATSIAAFKFPPFTARRIVRIDSRLRASPHQTASRQLTQLTTHKGLSL